MSKEYLEALKIGIPKLKKLYENNAKKMSSNDILGFDLTFSYLDKVLTELEAIDNANPSEALEFLETITTTKELKPFLEQAKLALIKVQWQKKVLNIIKEKGLDRSIIDYDSYDIWLEYRTAQFAKAIEENPTILNWDMFDNFIYTEEEFNILKEWLNND